MDTDDAVLIIPASGYYRIDYNTSKTHLDYQISSMALSYGATGTNSTGDDTYGLLVQFYGYGYKIVGDRNNTTSTCTVLNTTYVDLPIPLADFFNNSPSYKGLAFAGEEMLSPTGYFAV